jgi:hypothetical protein
MVIVSLVAFKFVFTPPPIISYQMMFKIAYLIAGFTTFGKLNSICSLHLVWNSVMKCMSRTIHTIHELQF